MKKIGLVLAAILVVLVAIVGKWAHDNLTVELPKYARVENPVWLDQNWTAAQRAWFHHPDQGTQTFGIPYEWFMALEQPALSLGAPRLLSDPQYLDRYGFIPSGAGARKPELPIGFAHGAALLNTQRKPWRNPQTNADMTGLGLTCAACHTGRFTYQGTTVLIDGAPALINLHNFQKGLFLSLLYTRDWPFRFSRFADRVLGPGASDNAKSQLRDQFEQVWSQLKAVAKADDKVKDTTIEEGYARLDALTHIGNIVFSIDLRNPANYLGYSAPVHFPRIWDAPWFEWVQYNGSIQQPMARNVGEALGVGATINLTGGKEELYTSSVQVKTLFELEQLIAGKQPNAHDGFQGLNSPKWEDTHLKNILPPINTDLAAKGAVLYHEICEGCHLPPVAKDSEFWKSDRWLPSKECPGESHLDLEMIDVTRIGTDPVQAEDMKNRLVVTPSALHIDSNEFGLALRDIVENTANHWYNSQQPPIVGELRDRMNGCRPNNARTLLAYKVRPLDGIWATPPYLHNGSVPTLYALLSPVEERPKSFYLGNREYDPVNVGYRVDEFPGGFSLDTTKRGNRNSGHEFTNTPGKEGVIGRLLSFDERRALVEYLKTL
jgi:hypothetical protein